MSQKDILEEKKLELEIEKLKTDMKSGRRFFTRNLQLFQVLLPFLVTISTVFVIYKTHFFEANSKLLEIKKTELTNGNAKLIEMRDILKNDSVSLVNKIAKYKIDSTSLRAANEIERRSLSEKGKVIAKLKEDSTNQTHEFNSLRENLSSQIVALNNYKRNFELMQEQKLQFEQRFEFAKYSLFDIIKQ